MEKAAPVVAGEYSDQDLARAKDLISSEEELVGVFRTSKAAALEEQTFLWSPLACPVFWCMLPCAVIGALQLKATLEGTLYVLTTKRLYRQVDAVGPLGGCPEGVAYSPGGCQQRPGKLVSSGSVEWAAVTQIGTTLPFVSPLASCCKALEPKEKVVLTMPNTPLAIYGGSKHGLPSLAMLVVKDAVAAANAFNAAKMGAANPSGGVVVAQVMVREG